MIDSGDSRPGTEHNTRFRIRLATRLDIEQLDELEYDAVDDEPFNYRQWRHLLSRAHAIVLVIEDLDALDSLSCTSEIADSAEVVDELPVLVGYGVLLLRKGSVSARLYSLAIHPSIRGQGHGRTLLRALASAAYNNGCQRVVLEVRADNRAAIKLYRTEDYQAAKWIDNYYFDGCVAYRMYKRLTP